MAAVAKNTYERTDARRTSGTAVDKNTYERDNDSRIFAVAAAPRRPLMINTSGRI